MRIFKKTLRSLHAIVVLDATSNTVQRIEVAGTNVKPIQDCAVNPRTHANVCTTKTIQTRALSVGMNFSPDSGAAVVAPTDAINMTEPLPTVPLAPAPTPAMPQEPVTVSVGHLPVLGNANAKVTVVEFADFRCPFCERFFSSAEKSMIADYVDTGKIKFAFRDYAFLGPESTVAGEAAECANAQGKFWKFHDWLFTHQADESNTAYYSKANLISYATQNGLDTAAFTTCLNSDTYASLVSQDAADATADGVSGTPTTFVNGVPVVGAVPYATLKATIDAALAK